MDAMNATMKAKLLWNATKWWKQQVFNVSQKLQMHLENLQHNISIKIEYANEEESSSFIGNESQWTVKIKRQKT